MPFGIGTDILNITNILTPDTHMLLPHLSHIFTEKEHQGAKERGQQSGWYYATRFAGKEAVYKSLSGLGIPFVPEEIEILNQKYQRPHVNLLGNTRSAFLLQTGQLPEIMLSLSYDTEYAIAFAFANYVNYGTQSN